MAREVPIINTIPSPPSSSWRPSMAVTPKTHAGGLAHPSPASWVICHEKQEEGGAFPTPQGEGRLGAPSGGPREAAGGPWGSTGVDGEREGR